VESYQKHETLVREKVCSRRVVVQGLQVGAFARRFWGIAEAFSSVPSPRREVYAMENLSIRRSHTWLAFAFLGCACSNASASTSASDDAMQVVQQWATAFSESNVDAIVSLYAPDALFFGTGSQTLVTEPADIRSYFEAALQRDQPRGAELLEHSVRVVSDDVVIVTGMDRVSGTRDGSVYANDGRVSFVLEKRGDSWQIVHFHRSAVPTS
jgi:uncharacterized protein (TIGR02246 family)